MVHVRTRVCVAGRLMLTPTGKPRATRTRAAMKVREKPRATAPAGGMVGEVRKERSSGHGKLPATSATDPARTKAGECEEENS